MKKIGILMMALLFSELIIGSPVALGNLLHDPQVDYPGSTELPLTQKLVDELHRLNEDGKIYQAWGLLAEHRDGYAQSAVNIFGSKITLQKCVVESNWKVVVSEEVRREKFDDYAKLFQRKYIEYLDKNHKYPDTYDIELMYQGANTEMGLPQTISVDLMFNTVPEDWSRRKFFDNLGATLGFGRYAKKMRWYHYVYISEARMSQSMVKIEGVSDEDIKRNYMATTKKIAKCMLKKLKTENNQPRIEPYETY